MKIAGPRMKQEIEECYGMILAPYAAVKPKKNSRDLPEDDREDNRGSFQRDRDRIIHTKAFRRLMYKTQVFVNHEGDHFRTRLTHTLEVAQLARGVCKSLALNEDLAEAIAYGHDLGHTPFGHAVEEFFDQILIERNLGRFYHNEQSVRVVDLLEIRSEEETGLNLTYEVREGILKHNRDRSGIYKNLHPDIPCSTLEGQVVALVDTIAYICHDLEDGIKSGIIEEAICQNPDMKEQFQEMSVLAEQYTKVKIQTNPYREPFFIRKLIHYFVKQLTFDSYERIGQLGLKNSWDVQKYAEQGIAVIGFSEENGRFFNAFRKMIYKNVYQLPTIKLMDIKAVEVAKSIFGIYEDHPQLLPPQVYYAYQASQGSQEGAYQGAASNPVRVIIDYIANMTDRSALEENAKLSNPSIRI